MRKKLISLIFLYGLSFSKTLDPVLKSAILPGWGQSELGEEKKKKIFTIFEFSALAACFASYGFSKHIQYNFKTFAANHANVQNFDNDRQFWVDIGNYINPDSHDNEHLRWRENVNLYRDNSLWSWDSYNNMKKFEKLRIKSDFLNRQGKFIAGAILINHIISSIDALYIKNIKKQRSLEFSSSIDKGNPRLELNFKF